jgi:hypothetical protein
LGRTIISSHPSFRKWAILLPWRTLMLGSFYFTSPFFLVRLLGLGDILDATMNGATALFIAFPFTVILITEYWYPIPLLVRLFSLARTLATASLAIGVREVVGYSSGGLDIGFQMMRLNAINRSDEALLLWLMVVGLVLIVDLVLGVTELILFERVRNSYKQ